MGALGTAVDDAVDHDLPPECAKMLRDIVFRTHLDVSCRALLGDPPACVEPMTVQLQPGARAVRATLRASLIVHIAGARRASRTPSPFYVPPLLTFRFSLLLPPPLVSPFIFPASLCSTWYIIPQVFS